MYENTAPVATGEDVKPAVNEILEEIQKRLMLSGRSTVIARFRRGKYVRIPEAWRGQVTHSQSIRKRKSKDNPKTAYKKKRG